MKITLKELRSIIRESVRAVLKETDSEELEPLRGPFPGAIGETSTNDPKYLGFIKDIFTKFATDPYSNGKSGIRGSEKRAALEELYSKLGLTPDQVEELESLNGNHIINFYFGTTFPIYEKNLAAIAKTAVTKILGIPLEEVMPGISAEEKKRKGLEDKGFESDVAESIMQTKFAKTNSSERLLNSPEIKFLEKIKDLPKSKNFKTKSDEMKKFIELVDEEAWPYSKWYKIIKKKL